MKIDEVVELPNGSVSFKAELTPIQVKTMVHWFIGTMIERGLFKVTEEKNEDTPVRH
jgi:hypothetical protein